MAGRSNGRLGLGWSPLGSSPVLHGSSGARSLVRVTSWWNPPLKFVHIRDVGTNWVPAGRWFRTKMKIFPDQTYRGITWMIPCRSTDEKREKDGRSGYKDKDQDGCHRTPSMSNSYVPPGQQWNPNQFNFSQLQLEHDLDYSNLSVQGTQRQGRQQQQQQQQLQHQQSQLNYPGLQYSQTQTPSPPHSTSSLHGAFTMPTNQQLPSQGSSDRDDSANRPKL